MSLFDELKRRNVIRVAAGYIVVAWLVIQVAGEILPPFGVGDDLIRLIIVGLAIGLLPVVVLAWVFEWTPEGIKVDEGAERQGPAIAAAARRWDRIIMVILTISVAYFIAEKIIEREAVEPTIAVLPFTVLSSDTAEDYLAVGIAEDVRGMLAQIPQLQVTWHVSSFSPRLQGLEIAEIAEQLNVAHLVTGTLRRQGNSLRVSSQLIDTRQDVVVWGQTFDRELSDVFAIQDEIAENIVANLRIKILGSIPASPDTNPEVVALVVQAAQIFFDGYDGSGAGIGDRMAALLDRAIELDPDYAPAYGWYVYAEGARAMSREIEPDEELRRRTVLIQKALAIDPEEPVTLVSMAWTEAYENKDPEAAAPLFERALRSGSGNGEVVRMVGRFAYQIDRYDEANRLLERATQLNPLCTSCVYALSRSYMVTERFEEALEMRERYLLLMGDSNRAGFSHYGLMKLLLDDAEGALEIFNDPDKVDGPEAIAGRAMALHSLGRADESDRALAELRGMEGVRAFRSTLDVYGWRGQADDAYELIYATIGNTSAENFDGFDLLNWLRNPQFRDLRTDPRWGDLRSRLGWPLERTTAIDIDLSLPE
jgi:TolB-like protein/tetratricopeptide (TPR) repeat protein